MYQQDLETDAGQSVFQSMMWLIMDFIEAFFKTFLVQDKEFMNTWKTVKREGNNKGQFGYYINPDVYNLVLTLYKYNIKSVIDLGSGAGIILLILYKLGFATKGYEIEDKLIEIANKLSQQLVWQDNTYKRDILKLSSANLNGYDAVYMWEPLHDKDLCEKFVKNLAKVMSKGQYIIYKQSGYIGEELRKNKLLIELDNTNHKNYWRPYQVYQKL